MSVRIGVVGGTGFVGRALCKAGIKRGLDVVSVSLQGCYPYSGHQFSQFQGALTPFWADSVVWRRVDVCKPTAIPALEKALQGCSAILHAVGTFKDDRQYPNRTLEDVNIVSVRNTLKAAEHIGASSFVLVSAISSPPLAHQDAVASKRKAESLLESTRGLSTSVLRPGFLYGMERVGKELLSHFVPLLDFAGTLLASVATVWREQLGTIP
eukprot:jgi/Chlat1/1694/Chrsp127S01925